MYPSPVMAQNVREVNDSALEIFWQAMRSSRPGPWASDHYEQSQHFTGVVYTVVDAMAQWIASSTVKLVKKVGKGYSTGETWETNIGPIPIGTRRSINPNLRQQIFRSMTQAGAQENDERWEPLDDGHPAWIPFRKPNPQQTISDILYEHTIQKCLTGSAFTWQVPNGYGEPAELYVIPQALTTAVPPSELYPNGAYRVYPLFTTGPFAVVPGYAASAGTTIPAEYVAVNRKWHPYIKYDGYSPLQACGTQLDILQQIDESRWYAFQQGIDPSIYIKLPPGTTEDQWRKLQNKIDENHAGTRNRKRPLALLGGAEPVPLSLAPNQMGFETGWTQLTEFVCAVFRTPAIVAGLAASASYAELYAALKQFYTGTLIPVCKNTGEHWSLHIVCPIWGDDIKVQIDPPAIDDQEQLMTRLSFLHTCGALKKGEARIACGFDPFGDEQDDELTLPDTPDEYDVNINGPGERKDKGSSKDDRRSPTDRARPDPKNSSGSSAPRMAKALLNGILNGDSLHPDDESV